MMMVLLVYCLGDGDGGGTHRAECKCSVEAHHSHHSTWSILCVMMCTHTPRHTMQTMDVVMHI